MELYEIMYVIKKLRKHKPLRLIKLGINTYIFE